MNKLLTALLLSLPFIASAHLDDDTAPEPLPLPALMKAFNWDFDKTKITTQKVADNLYVLFGVGGNVAASIGEDGVLIVDNQFPQMVPKMEAAIKRLGGSGKVDIAVTTHWHFDHAQGNLALGPKGTWLVAHQNSRTMMKEDHLINLVMVAYQQKAYPKEALPNITFENDMQFHFNEQRIDLVHFGPAHTTGDAAIIFRGSNAVHMGDVFNMAGYPFIDAGNGGDLDGVINFCEQVLALINNDTVVIPGHGPVVDYQAMQDYVVMLSVIRDRMKTLVAEGASLDEVYAAQPTAEFDEIRGNNKLFINRAYHSLRHRNSEAP